jgi:hypothetical protein
MIDDLYLHLIWFINKIKHFNAEVQRLLPEKSTKELTEHSAFSEIRLFK